MGLVGVYAVASAKKKKEKEKGGLLPAPGWDEHCCDQ